MFQIEHLLMETLQHIPLSHEEDLPTNKEEEKDFISLN